MLRASEQRDKPTSDLLERERLLQGEVFSMKFQLAPEQLTKSAKLREPRRDLARIKTVLRERGLGMHTAPEETTVAESEDA